MFYLTLTDENTEGVPSFLYLYIGIYSGVEQRFGNYFGVIVN